MAPIFSLFLYLLKNNARFIPAARPGIQWSHEIASERMLDYLIEDNGIEIAEDDLKFVKDLIQGIPRSQRSEKKYLFEIVANKVRITIYFSSCFFFLCVDVIKILLTNYSLIHTIPLPNPLFPLSFSMFPEKFNRCR